VHRLSSRHPAPGPDRPAEAALESQLKSAACRRALRGLVLVTASPPGVRRGSASPFWLVFSWASPVVRPLAQPAGQSPNQGHSPEYSETPAARQSLASHQAAKPRRARPCRLLNCGAQGLLAGEPRGDQKSSKTGSQKSSRACGRRSDISEQGMVVQPWEDVGLILKTRGKCSVSFVNQKPVRGPRFWIGFYLCYAFLN
jgi:hypothetical protein